MKPTEIWGKNLLVLAVSQFIYRAGTRSLIPFLPLFIHNLGKTSIVSTAIWSGWIFAAPFLVSFFMTPIWGSFGDKFGRKLMTLFAVFGFALSQFLMGLSADLTQLLLFASLQEIMGGFYPAAISLTASNTPKEKTAYSLGIIQFANGSGNVVGPVIGGVLADLFGYREVFFLVAATVALSGTLVLFFVKEENFVQQKQSYYSFINNWKHLISKRILISCGLFLLIYSLSVSILRPTFSLFIQSLNLHVETSTITGILLGVYGGTSAIGSALFGKFLKRFGIKSLTVFTVLIASLSSIFIAFTSTVEMISILLIFSGFSLGLILPLIYTLLTNNTESDRKAGVFGIGSSFQIIGNLVGSALSGLIVASLGISAPFVIAGLLFLFVIPISIFGLQMKTLSS
ncbi:MAG: MFS transporter [Ignavibacteriales bacterium]|nr:MFS transporter [Ignavibacteriales bacterium]